MDVAKPKKAKPRFKYALAVVGVLVCAVFVGRYLWRLGLADHSVDGANMVFAEVKHGEFTVTVRGSGLLVADHIQWLTSNVPAQVEKIAAKPGKTVKQGEVIVVLANPQLHQTLKESQWELEAQEAESQAQRVSEESLLLDQESLVLDAELNYESTQLKLTAQQTLIKNKDGSIARIDFERTQLEAKQRKKRWQNQLKRVDKMRERLVAQNAAREARLAKMRKTVERMQTQVDNLVIRATMDSTVQELPLEIGQSVQVGSRLAKLAEQGSYLAELEVPEIKIRDVQVGQKVLLDTRNNTMQGVVTRIDPIVVNGNVEVDVEITGDMPKGLRPDMSVSGEITITQLPNTLYVDRPLYSQSESVTSAYKLNGSKNLAQRTTVKYGQGSVHKIQILSGLEAGESIIVSDTSNWDNYQSILIR